MQIFTLDEGLKVFGIIEWRKQFGATWESFVHFDFNPFIHPHDSEICDSYLN